jgi:hypothetical protein
VRSFLATLRRGEIQAVLTAAVMFVAWCAVLMWWARRDGRPSLLQPAGARHVHLPLTWRAVWEMRGLFPGSSVDVGSSAEWERERSAPAPDRKDGVGGDWDGAADVAGQMLASPGHLGWGAGVTRAHGWHLHGQGMSLPRLNVTGVARVAGWEHREHRSLANRGW